MIQVGVGLFILWSITMRPPAFMRRSAGIAGAVSSFLTMFFGATGPFIAAFVKTQDLDRLGHTATHAALMTIQHALKTVAFGFLGFAWLRGGGVRHHRHDAGGENAGENAFVFHDFQSPLAALYGWRGRGWSNTPVDQGLPPIRL